MIFLSRFQVPCRLSNVWNIVGMAWNLNYVCSLIKISHVFQSDDEDETVRVSREADRGGKHR